MLNIEQVQQRIEQLECIVLKQEAIIKDQQQEISNQIQQMQSQQQILKKQYEDRIESQRVEYQQYMNEMEARRISQNAEDLFHQQLTSNQRNSTLNMGLKPNEILTQFYQLKPFGKGELLSTFLKSVEATLALCGTNEELKIFGTNIVKNQKLRGNAAKSISLLPDYSNWDDIKKQLIRDFSPRMSYSTVFNYCRNIKVSNLNELFNIYTESKYKLNEIYVYDDQKPDIYSPENIDRDLSELVISKIDGQFRACITVQTPSLEYLYNRFSQLKLLHDSRAIDFKSRKTTNTNNNKKETEPKSRNKQNWNNKSSNSAQTKFVPKPQSNQYTNCPTPMDIGNLEDKEGNEVNFLLSPQNNCYP